MVLLWFHRWLITVKPLKPQSHLLRRREGGIHWRGGEENATKKKQNSYPVIIVRHRSFVFPTDARSDERAVGEDNRDASHNNTQMKTTKDTRTKQVQRKKKKKSLKKKEHFLDWDELVVRK